MLNVGDLSRLRVGDLFIAFCEDWPHPAVAGVYRVLKPMDRVPMPSYVNYPLDVVETWKEHGIIEEVPSKQLLISDIFGWQMEVVDGQD